MQCRTLVAVDVSRLLCLEFCRPNESEKLTLELCDLRPRCGNDWILRERKRY